MTIRCKKENTEHCESTDTGLCFSQYVALSAEISLGNLAEDTSRPENVNRQIFSSSAFIWLFYQSFNNNNNNKNCLKIQIWTPQGTAILVQSVPTQSSKHSVRCVSDTFALHVLFMTSLTQTLGHKRQHPRSSFHDFHTSFCGRQEEKSSNSFSFGGGGGYFFKQFYSSCIFCSVPLQPDSYITSPYLVHPIWSNFFFEVIVVFYMLHYL